MPLRLTHIFQLPSALLARTIDGPAMVPDTLTLGLKDMISRVLLLFIGLLLAVPLFPLNKSIGMHCHSNARHNRAVGKHELSENYYLVGWEMNRSSLIVDTGMGIIGVFCIIISLYSIFRPGLVKK